MGIQKCPNSIPEDLNPFLGLTPAQERYLIYKRIVDFFAALGILVFTIPILACCGLLIQFFSRWKGETFYKQKRVGQWGLLFNIIKIRTMRSYAEDETGPIWAQENDPRVISKIGHLLRRSHLDELLQVINVLKGEMSLVGPRPERSYFTAEFQKKFRQYYRRFAVKPGITGLAQVFYKYGDTPRDVKKKLAYDILYIKKMSWTLDLSIIFLTLARFFDKGAK